MKRFILILFVLLCGCTQSDNALSKLAKPIEKDMNEVGLGDIKCVLTMQEDVIDVSFTSTVIDTYDLKSESDMESLFQILCKMNSIYDNYKRANYFEYKGHTLDEFSSFKIHSDKHTYYVYLYGSGFKTLDIDNETIYVYWLDTMTGSLYTEPDASHRTQEKITIPYIGMDESCVSSTLCGPYDKLIEKTLGQGINKYRVNQYIWYAKNGYDIPLIVDCENGIVSNVNKYYVSTYRVYWNRDGTPNFDRYYGKGEENTDTPDYDVQDYDDPYDFWIDHDTDFEDYEEAEDYWFDWN